MCTGGPVVSHARAPALTTRPIPASVFVLPAAARRRAVPTEGAEFRGYRIRYYAFCFATDRNLPDENRGPSQGQGILFPEEFKAFFLFLVASDDRGWWSSFEHE
ncbi:unnamed protein product, partial [Iphiclides podalirius]